MSETNKNRPRVGIAVVILNNGKILLGKRKNAHGDGSWGTPGGHLEFGESIEQCAVREVIEETGLNVANVNIVSVVNDVFEKEQKHYLTVVVFAQYISGKACVLEPDKCEEWQWFAWGDWPQPLFKPFNTFVQKDLASYADWRHLLINERRAPGAGCDLGQ